ncbi:rab proteins geranylgeranyltransferase component A [Stachybotrys elegans]|uniref:Rab proteins geranylgeranyltransferase n=1 Tax=Stachybotrys elegans TaxID=80388 RepID=A0A8K0ST04_9HYPO|nr:rab proteins geranylgeranyltransferase component A [Stachybotrys elegans]
MESLSDIKWDVVISGTGLQQSLLALALSRSGSNILHVDGNEYYGGSEAALSLDELDDWAKANQAADGPGPFASAQVTRGTEDLPSRRYALALAPQLIHARSQLLSQLVSSKAYRQIEFLAVGSFYIYQPSEASAAGSLARIPSTREDVFSNTSIPAKSKRSLMKFLRFVLEYESEPQAEAWKPVADAPLTEFLASYFKLDASLQSYILALTLSVDGRITVQSGLAVVHRHLTSMGVFGAGFAAVYPKWGGLAEIAQVGCRAGAVGGAVYMLGTDIQEVKPPAVGGDGDEAELEIALSNDIVVKSKTLVQTAPDQPAKGSSALSRLTAVVQSPLASLFETTVEGGPTPAVAVVAFPPGTISMDKPTEYPIHVMVHSSETGECPSGQCTIYFSTVSGPSAKESLEKALSLLLSAAGEGEAPPCLYRVYYEQRMASAGVTIAGNTISFSCQPVDLSFNDSTLNFVREAWTEVSGEKDQTVYMQFEDREQVEDDEVYDV